VSSFDVDGRQFVCILQLKCDHVVAMVLRKFVAFLYHVVLTSLMVNALLFKCTVVALQSLRLFACELKWFLLYQVHYFKISSAIHAFPKFLLSP